jgi:hypothetical protein
MANKVHHNIMHFNDIKLLSLDGNVRINTTKQNKVYINSDNSTLTINENCALGFGTVPNYGQPGDILVSDGELGTVWSNKYTNLEADVQQVKEYVQELKTFFDAFKSSVYVEGSVGTEFNYNTLINGTPDIVIVGSTALETEVEKLKTYVDELKSFFSSFQQSVFLSDAEGNELNYSSLL